MYMRTLLQLVATALTVVVSSCFFPPGGSGNGSDRLSLSWSRPSLSPSNPSSQGSTSTSTRIKDKNGSEPRTARRTWSHQLSGRTTLSAHSESLRTRGGGSDGSISSTASALPQDMQQHDPSASLEAGDPSLSEADPDVWDIIQTERRRQVRMVEG